ncbi:MAG: COG4223 family protein [Gemmobacter sp.]
MATPRTPRKGKSDADTDIAEAELVAEPGVDPSPDTEIPAMQAPDPMPDPLILTDDPRPAPDLLPQDRPEPRPTDSPEAVLVGTALPPPPTPDPEPPRQSSAMPLVIGGVVAALIGFGVSQVVPKGWPLAAATGLEATVAAQATEIARLSAALDALPAPAPPPDLSPLSSQLSALADRIAAAEASVAAIPAPVAPPDPGPRIGALEARLATLEALPPGTVIEGGTGPDPAAMAALSQEIATLKSDIAAQSGASAAAIAEVNAAAEAARAALAEAQAQATALTEQAEAAANAANARAALGRIEAALETGAPFASAVAALTAAGTEVPEALANAAATGVPTLAALQTSFPDAARQALDESLRAGMGEGTWDRVGAFLRSQTGARSLEPREGGDPDAILSRAEAALRAGDLATTLTEVATLPEPGQAALATWTAAAQVRIAALADLATLSAAVEG